MTTLVTFLGTGNYKKLRYLWENRECSTRYVAEALANLLNADSVLVLATKEAKSQHEDGLRKALENTKPRFISLPTGSTPDEMKRQFTAFLDALNVPDEETLIIDITHGFRVQPFLAATALAVLSAAGRLPGETFIVYGAAPTPPKDGDPAPIWEITPFLHRMNEAFGVITFLRTGDASLLVDALIKADNNMRRRMQQQGKNPAECRSRALIQALQRFSQELHLLRVPALTIGIGGRESSSAMLLQALDEYAQDARKEHPTLALLLHEIRENIAPLACDTLSDPKGWNALQQLAEQFFTWGRYAEAASVTREGLVCLYAAGRDGTDAGKLLFSNDAREMAEKRFSSIKENRQIASIRNTIVHCAFQQQPLERLHIQAQWRPNGNHPLMGELQGALNEFRLQVQEGPKVRRTIFVTRHAGAREWAKRQGIIVDDVAEHLDPECINPGDLVIGSLPVHLAAEICRRGGRYKHLSLEIPRDMRGQELSADDMEKYGARLEEFFITSRDGNKDA